MELRLVIAYASVGIVWGTSNSFLKRAQEKYSKTQSKEGGSKRIISKTGLETIKELLTDLNMLIPFVVNQCGSVMFYYLLASQPLSVAAPLCNTLTFAFTAISAYLLGERAQNPLLLFTGVFFVISGIYVSFISS